MNKYETVLMTIIWNIIMQKMNTIRKSLQSIECTILQGVLFYKKFRNEFKITEAKILIPINVKKEEQRSENFPLTKEV